MKKQAAALLDEKIEIWNQGKNNDEVGVVSGNNSNKFLVVSNHSTSNKYGDQIFSSQNSNNNNNNNNNNDLEMKQLDSSQQNRSPSRPFGLNLSLNPTKYVSRFNANNGNLTVFYSTKNFCLQELTLYPATT